MTYRKPSASSQCKAYSRCSAAEPVKKLRQTVARDPERELVNGLFTVLDHAEREILLRSLLLSEDDDEISTELKLPASDIRRTRAKARVLFRIPARFEEQNVAAPA